MQIIRCDRSHANAWNAFVQRSPRASFYHRYEWRDVNDQCFGHRSVYLAAVEDGQIVGVFPFVQLKSLLFGNIACSMPFVNFGGPCGDRDEIEQQLLAAAEQVANEWRVDYLEIRSQRPLGDRYPSSDHKVSMTVALERDPDVLWNRYKTGHRQDIRRGYSNGFTTRFGGLELLDDFFAILSESWRGLGTPIYRIYYLEKILLMFPEHIRLCIVSAKDGTPASGAFYGLHNDVVEGMWLGTRDRYRRDYVGYVLYWEMIKDACEGGYRRFHLGRSTKDSGAETFKRKWNGEVEQLYWHYILRTRTEIPSLNPNNPKYATAIRWWRQMPISATQMIGPFIARSLP